MWGSLQPGSVVVFPFVAAGVRWVWSVAGVLPRIDIREAIGRYCVSSWLLVEDRRPLSSVGVWARQSWWGLRHRGVLCCGVDGRSSALFGPGCLSNEGSIAMGCLGALGCIGRSFGSGRRGVPAVSVGRGRLTFGQPKTGGCAVGLPGGDWLLPRKALRLCVVLLEIRSVLT